MTYFFRKYRLAFFILLLCAFAGNLSAQSTFTSEDDLKKEAKKLFDNEQYAEAYPLYSQLLSIYPKDPNYNYRFGICMLYTSENKEKPISYLEYASKQPDVEKDVFYFLGKAYHMNYRFDDAINAYNQFKKVGSSYMQKKFQVDKQIDMCRSGKALLKNITDLAVLEKKQVGDGEFFRSYDLSDIGGKLLVKPEDFQSSLDKKAGSQSIIYLAKNNTQIYYSSYGVDGKNGKDIYMIKKIPGGEWSSPVSLGDVINTSFDEDYPFLHPNGKALYFSSKGHNSMGGYDIFKSTYNDQTAAWNPPVNLDFAINSPDDDILYVTDSLERTAFFSSKRFSPNGSIDVYKISTERKQVDVAVINGIVGRDSEGSLLKTKITVKNTTTGELVGIFNSDPQTGAYSMTVPGGGQLLFTVESEGYKTQSDVVVLPPQTVFKPFREELYYEAKTDKLIVKNFFDEAIDDSNYLLALNFIKEKARLEVNAAGLENEITSNTTNVIDTAPKASEPDSVSKVKNISNDAILNIAKEDATDAQNDAKEIRTKADVALAIASQKSQNAQTKYTEADNTSNPAEAVEKRKEADKLSREAVAAFNFAKKLDNDAAAKQEEADLATNYAKELETALTSKNPELAITQLEDQKNRLEKMNTAPKGVDNAFNSIKIDADNKQKEVEREKEKLIDIKKEIVGIDEDIKLMNENLKTTSNEQLAEGMKAQIKDLEDSKVKKQSEQVVSENKIKTLEVEATNLRNEADVVSGMLTEIKSMNETTVDVKTIDKQKLQQQVNDYQIKTNPVDQGNGTGTTETPGITTTPAISIVNTNEEPPKDSVKTPAISIISANEEKKDTSKTTTANTINTIPAVAIVNANETKKDSSKTTNLGTTDTTSAVSIVSINEVKKDSSKSVPSTTTTTTPSISIVSANEVKKDSIKTTLENTIDTKAAVEVVKANETKKDSVKTASTNTVPVVAVIDTGKDSVKKSTLTPIVNESTSIPPVNTSTENTSANKNSTIETQVAELISKSEESGKQADNLNTEAIALRAEAFQKSTAEEREDALLKVKELESQAMQKQQEASESEQKGQELKFKASDEKLQKYSTVLANSNLDQAAMGDLMKDEASYYFKEAQKQRELAMNSQSYTSRQEALEKAKENEEKAIERQKKAEELYVKANGDVVTLNSNSNNTVTQNTSSNQAAPVVSVNTATTNTVSVANTNTTTTTTSAPVVLTPVQLKTVQQTANYTQYATMRLQADSSAKVAKAEYAVANDFKIKADLNAKLSQETTAQIEAIKEGEQIPDSLLKKANEYKMEAKKYSTKYDSVRLIAQKIELVSTSKIAESELFLHSLDKKTYSDIQSAYATNPVAGTNKVVASAQQNPKNTNNQVATVISPARNNTATPERNNNTTTVNTASSILPATQPLTEGFVIVNRSVYSANQPIPIDPKLPEGLVFKVQIGAFKNQIRQDLFKGMNPLSGERTTQGLTRYTAGMFKNFDNADDAKNKIKNLGYKDAFVVAFLNGKRISVNDAIAQNGTVVAQNNTTNQTLAPQNTKENTTNTQIENNSANSGSNPAVNSNQIVQATDIATVTGLVYSVQVGVYSKPVTSAQLLNTEPLYTEKLTNGMLRYTSGAYNDIKQAIAAKDIIVQKGIKDAFIVVFKDGKRVTGSDISVPKTNTNSTAVPVTNSTAAANISAADVVFKVQLGAYREQVPIDVANKYLSITGKGISNYKDESGMTIYTVGKTKSYEEANKLKAEMKAAGIADAFVVAYSKNKKISVEAAVKALGQ